MINKFYKIINNKYYKFFRFIFFLRYLFGLFLASIVLFLLVPSFFNYEKKSEVLKDYLFKNYDFKISKYEKLEYKFYPFPNFEFKNAVVNLDSSSIELNIKKLKVYPKLINIYNFKNFQFNKIVLKSGNIALEILDFKILIKKILTQKNKLLLDDLKIKINNNTQSLALLENIKFSNFGNSKNTVRGNIFDKEFKVELNDNVNNINFKLIKSGINIDINFNKDNNNNFINGELKSKILNTKLKFNFNYGENKLNIYNSFFRSKNLSFKNNSLITFKPFLDSSAKFEIEDINIKIFNKLKKDKVLISKNILKKINTKIEVNFNEKKYSRSFIDKLNLKFDLAYGRLNYSKIFSFSENIFQCRGNLNLIEEYPLLFFDCSVNSNNKRNILKKFNIYKKKDNKIFNLDVKGNLSILNKKINFKEISLNENYKASNEDLSYFKEKFESILFDEGFLEIFNSKKIKEFILETS